MTEIKPSPDHRRALEARLLARYDQLHPQPKEMPMQTFARRHATQLAFAAVLAIALGAAAQAPAQLTKQVGTRVEIETAASIDSAELRKAIESLQEEPQGGFGGPERRAWAARRAPRAGPPPAASGPPTVLACRSICSAMRCEPMPSSASGPRSRSFATPPSASPPSTRASRPAWRESSPSISSAASLRGSLPKS